MQQPQNLQQPYGYPPQGGYPPQQPQGYPPYPYPYPPQGGAPPQQDGQQPSQQGYPPQQPQGYPPYPYPYPPQGQYPYPPQGYPPQQPYGYPPQGGYPQGGAPPQQQQQQSGGWATFPPLASFGEWDWDHDGKPWRDVPNEGHPIKKFERSPNPKYCVTATKACPPSGIQCTVDVFDLANEMCIGKLSTEKPAAARVFDSEVWGDHVFSVGGDTDAVVRVYSIASTEQIGYWKGSGEESLSACCIMETTALTGIAATFNKQEMRFFDINTCKPSGKTSGGWESRADWLFTDPVDRNVFYLIDICGKIYQYDIRTKKKTRTFPAVADWGLTQVSFPATSGGKMALAHGCCVSIVDTHTGKLLHKATMNSPGTATLEKNLLVIGQSRKLWFFDTNKFSKEEIDFESAEHDLSVLGYVNSMGYVQNKIYLATNSGWKTLSNPSVK